jgi:magnesium transporter
MIRALSIDEDGIMRATDGVDAVHRPKAGGLCWIDIQAPDEDTLSLLGTRLGFHPLALEDCAHQDQRPKAEEYGDHLFVVTQGFECSGDILQDLAWHELHAFIGAGFLVTVHDGPVLAVDHAWKRVAGDLALLKRGVDFVHYLLLDKLVDENFPILDRIADELESIEEDVLKHPREDSLARIFALKQRLVMMRKVLSPQRDVVGALARRDDAIIHGKTSFYFRDVFDHLSRAVESIEANRDILSNALDAYHSATSQRTNEIMKALALLSAVFMPLTFITGFFGQNFEAMPFSSVPLMWGMLGSLVLSPAFLLFWFKSRRWF